MAFTELWKGGPVFDAGKAFPVTTDSVLLADFIRPRGRGLELCSGSGLVSLLLLNRSPALSLVLADIHKPACDLAEKNLAANGLEAQVLCRDVRQLREAEVGRFDFVFANPPYFEETGGKADDPVRSLARGEETCSLDDCVRAAGRLMGQGGAFFAVYPVRRMAEAIGLMRACGLEPKRLRFVTHSPDRAPSLFLAEARKGGGVGLVMDPTLILRDEDGRDSEEAKRIYHLGGE